MRKALRLNPLSYLQSAKLGVTEQQWAAQLAAFDFDIKYWSGRSNRNADALLRQYVSGSDLVKHSLSGTPVPTSLQQSCPDPVVSATHGFSSSIPLCVRPLVLTGEGPPPEGHLDVLVVKGSAYPH